MLWLSNHYFSMGDLTNDAIGNVMSLMKCINLQLQMCCWRLTNCTLYPVRHTEAMAYCIFQQNKYLFVRFFMDHIIQSKASSLERFMLQFCITFLGASLTELCEVYSLFYFTCYYIYHLPSRELKVLSPITISSP